MNERLRAIVRALPLDERLRGTLERGFAACSDVEQGQLVQDIELATSYIRDALARLEIARLSAKRRPLQSVVRANEAEVRDRVPKLDTALKDLLDCGVHFGHQTKRWNPKMKPYIFGERNGIYIINLAKTAQLFKDAEQFVHDLVAEGRTILFVGTKRQAQDAIAEEASRCGMYFVNQRWLGGLLTNFATIQRSLARLRDLEAMETDGRYETITKKEIAQVEKEKRKLQKHLEGIRNMTRLPDAVFVVDTRREKIAVDEARKLRIPVIGVVDTNCDPDLVDFVIPGNDDALRAIRLFASRIADAVIAGRGIADSHTESARSDGEHKRPPTRDFRRAPHGPTPAGHLIG